MGAKGVVACLSIERLVTAADDAPATGDLVNLAGVVIGW
jgi:hypothetical protein